MRLSGFVAIAVLLMALCPRAAWAWTPGTHIMLSEAVLRSLGTLPTAVAGLLQAFPYDFLYGSIAADTRTAGLGHSYWESRFETHLGEGHARRAKEVILLDHNRSDDLLDRVLSPTIFSTPTNRRIFRGMVYVTDSESWQRVFKVAKEMSRHDLPDDDVERYVGRAYDFVIDFLVRADRSEPYLLDPAGEEPLRMAKVIRRDTLKLGGGGESALVDEAARHFALPSSALDYARSVASPIIPGPWPPIAD